jgi:hypothetical protein
VWFDYGIWLNGGVVDEGLWCDDSEDDDGW